VCIYGEEKKKEKRKRRRRGWYLTRGSHISVAGGGCGWRDWGGHIRVHDVATVALVVAKKESKGLK
jgi:hypothetical protein